MRIRRRSFGGAWPPEKRPPEGCVSPAGTNGAPCRRERSALQRGPACPPPSSRCFGGRANEKFWLRGRRRRAARPAAPRLEPAQLFPAPCQEQLGSLGSGGGGCADGHNGQSAPRSRLSMSPLPLPRRAVQLAPSSLALVLRRRSQGPREAAVAEAEAEVDCCEDEARGAAVFQAFRRANAACYWNAGLARAVGRVRLQGWLRGGVLLLQGPPAPLQLLRDAWLRRALRAPKGFHIRAVGE